MTSRRDMMDISWEPRPCGEDAIVPRTGRPQKEDAPSARRQPVCRQRGMTLIEVLVAVVVLSIGLLGLAALQMTSLQSGHSSYLRSQATWLAYDLADRMRARRDDAISNGVYNDSSGDDDRNKWDADVTNFLGAGATGSAIVTSNISNTYADVEIRIQWTDSRGNIKDGDGATDSGDQTDTQTFVYKTRI